MAEAKKISVPLLGNDVLNLISTGGSTVDIDALVQEIEDMRTELASVDSLTPVPYSGNLNDLTDTGIYTANGTVTLENNFPVALSGGYYPLIEVYKTTDKWVVQRVSWSNNQGNYVYTRGLVLGSWNMWTLILNDINFFPSKSLSNTTIYVNGATGDDSNSGGNSNPLKTISKAISLIPDIVQHDYTINIVSGHYDEPVLLHSKSGRGSITFTRSGNSNITCQNFYIYGCTCTVSVNFFEINTGLVSFYSYNNKFVNFNSCSSSANTLDTNYCFQIRNTTYCSFGSCVINRRGIAIGSEASSIYLNNVGGTGNGTVLHGAVLSRFHKTSSVSISGTTAQTLVSGSQVIT